MKSKEELGRCMMCGKEITKGENFLELVFNRWSYDTETGELGYRKIYKEKFCTTCYRSLKRNEKQF